MFRINNTRPIAAMPHPSDNPIILTVPSGKNVVVTSLTNKPITKRLMEINNLTICLFIIGLAYSVRPKGSKWYGFAKVNNYIGLVKR